MWIPKKFEETDTRNILKLIQAYPFATILSPGTEGLLISKLPLVASLDKELFLLKGHFAKANPHWKTLKKDKKATLLFDGPHAYISPAWYPEPRAVPTWNYASVQFEADVQIIENRQWLLKELRELVARHERSWKMEPYSDYVDELLSGVIGVEFLVKRIEAKFKLSQHRSREERLSVAAALKKGGHCPLVDLAKLMEASIEGGRQERTLPPT